MPGNPYRKWNSLAFIWPYWIMKGCDGMVKGVSRQVIVVKSPDPRFFEQAIFIVKEEALGRGPSPEDVLREAGRAAEGYLRRNSAWRRRWRQVPPAAYTAAGALAATLCWVLALCLV